MSGGSREPEHYEGPLGQTRRDHIHFACPCGTLHSAEVVVSIDCRRDPVLARRLVAGDLDLFGVVCPTTRQLGVAEVPVIYHDPGNHLFVLVLPEAARTRELSERAALLTRLAAEPTASVPRYVVEFAVAYGAAGLRRYLEREAERALGEVRRTRLTSVPPAPHGPRDGTGGRRPSGTHRAQTGEPSAREQRARVAAGSETDPYTMSDSDELFTEQLPALDASERLADSGGGGQGTGAAGSTQVTPMAPVVAPGPPAGQDGVVEPIESEPTSPVMSPAGTGRGSGPVTGASAAGGSSLAEPRWPAARDPIVRRVGAGGTVEILVRGGPAELALLVTHPLEVRVQLHRMPNYPLIVLVLGSAAALAGQPGAGQPVWVALDFASDSDRAVLEALTHSFEIAVEVYDRDRDDRLDGRRRVSAPLGENVRCAVAGAGDYLKRVPPGDRSFSRAMASFLSPDHDRLGLTHSYAGDLDESLLEVKGGAPEVLRAVALVKRFSQPPAEDWLILLRGYPVERWRSRSAHVVQRAVELGLWPGPAAAQIAVSEGLARSRKELVAILGRQFTHLLGQKGHGLDPGQVRDNWDALTAEAAALGLSRSEWQSPRSQPIVSEAEPVASGTIRPRGERAPGDSGWDVASPAPATVTAAGSGRIGAGGRSFADPDADEPTGVAEVDGAAPGPQGKPGSPGQDRVARGEELDQLTEDGLRALLTEKTRRMAAAIELCRRGEPAAAPAVFDALAGMSRAEAGRVLASAVGFGHAAEPHLLDQLKGRKGYLRQGAALALGVLKTEAGVEAICDVLFDEPTEIWREVARAIGEAGPGAVMPLAARLSHRPDAPRERVAWALAHIAARGGRRPVEAVAAGRDPVAAGTARHALELCDLAKSDHLQVRGHRTRDQTVNRAFSRKFFEALGATDPGGSEGHEGVDLSAPAMLLDESDVLEAVDVDADLDEVEAELDEADILPT